MKHGSNVIGRRAFIGLLGAATFMSVGLASQFGSPADRQWNVDMSNLDAFHAAQGDKGVIKAFATASKDDAINTMYWIQERGLVSLYGLPVSALSDSRVEVRAAAVAVLERIPPADLKSFVPAISAAVDGEPNARRRAILTQLLTAIEDA